MLVHKMEARLQSSLTSSLLEVTSGKVRIFKLCPPRSCYSQVLSPKSLSLSDGVQALDQGIVKTLLTSAKTLDQILEEATSLLKMFWRAALPKTENAFQHVRKVSSLTVLQFCRQLLKISQDSEPSILNTFVALCLSKIFYSNSRRKE